MADIAEDADKTIDVPQDADATMDDTDSLAHIAELQRDVVKLATAALVCSFYFQTSIHRIYIV